ncbi:MAG: hypothetical protein JWN86_4256 [Planctomycetota bacterium]|nr:hypothetical protein [Planctomycetota bacterium]
MTSAVLDRQDLASITGLVWPGRAADALEDSGAAFSDPDGLLALADLRAKQARRSEVYARRDAPALYLDAIEAASLYLAGIPVSAMRDPLLDPREQEGRMVYNTAVAGFLRAAAGTWMRFDQDWRAKMEAQGIQVRMSGDPGAWDPDHFDHFYFANDYKVIGIHDPKHADGLGVPLIAERRTPPFAMVREPAGEERFYPRRLQAYPATAILRAGRGEDGRSRVVTLELLDPMRTDQVPFDGGARRLANDLTTPLSFYFTRLPLPQITQIGLLRPAVLEKQTGLYLLHPYERGKIPVVLVHGLWSSPDTWHRALNELRGDPALRERYQFWVYFYPTGDPFLYSATKLRQSLAEVRQTLDPELADPAFDQMVLVGHSMGGLLSRLMVVDSETTFWDTIANRPFSELQAGPGQRDLLSKALFFEANPSIRRVIFIATPHRGSTMSGQFIGRLGNSLIRLPGLFEATQHDLLSQNGANFFKNSHPAAPATSITQLSPRSGTLAAVNARPIAPGVTYHSIVAKAAPGPLESSSDLIVPYSSSHLDGAASELVVDGNHACLGSPATIGEIRRILTLHIRESDPILERKRDAEGHPAAVGISTSPKDGDHDRPRK